MKSFLVLNCFSAVLAAINDASGKLEFTVSSNILNIKGTLAGLPVSMSGASIHVHEGTQCDDPDQINGVLKSSGLDGFLKTTYTTDSSGQAQVSVKAKGYVLTSSEVKDGLSYVEGRCIVLHGLAQNNLSPRVATGKIKSNDDGVFSAEIGVYPGQGTLTQISGRLTVTGSGGEIELSGAVQGLAKNINGAGIHVHEGTDCTSASAIGGHLYYTGNGFVETYDTDADGSASVNIKTPDGGYVLRNSGTREAAIEGRCVVAHAADGAGLAVGKIICQDDTKCTATMQPYPKPIVEISGTLQITEDNEIVMVTGVINGLPRSITSGIHVHEGEDCTNNGAIDNNGILVHLKGHLFSNAIDGWAFPEKKTYNTDTNGVANIDVSARTHYLDNSDYPDMSVKNRCIVLHGASPEKLSDRVAIGKIVQDGDDWSASIELYPGPNALKDLGSTPSGKLVVTGDYGVVKLKGTISGLGKNLQGAGIHVHTGTDCTGGDDTSSRAAVNKVIGGHLVSRGDGFDKSEYTSNVNGEAKIDIKLPKGAYTRLAADASGTKKSYLQNRCIVVHKGDNIDRVAIGQIICIGTICTAAIKPYPTPVGPLAGELAITYDSGKEELTIKGSLTGLPREVTGAGIHVHEGTECDDKDKIGAHLYSNMIDGWAFPTKVTYDTNAAGEATVLVKAKSHVLSQADGTVGTPSVENHCIVMHGVTPSSLSPRVAVGKILKQADGKYSAEMKTYPLSTATHPDGTALAPSGTLTVTQNGADEVQITGTLKGMGRNLGDAGIHIHTGTDCTGSGKTNMQDVNEVIGGHLFSRGDGFKNTVYSSDRFRNGEIDITPPAKSYVLRDADTTDGATAVDGHCIVLHDASTKKRRVGVGKIICTDTGCKAAMKPYPTEAITAAPKPYPDPATEKPVQTPAPEKPVQTPAPEKPVQTPVPEKPVQTPVPPKSTDAVPPEPTEAVTVCDTDPCINGVATMLITLSAMVFYSIFAI